MKLMEKIILVLMVMLATGFGAAVGVREAAIFTVAAVLAVAAKRASFAWQPARVKATTPRRIRR